MCTRAHIVTSRSVGLLRTFVTAARETGPFRLKGFHIVVIDDRVKLRCKCNRMFREKASRVRDGAQFNCPDCYRLLTLSKETQDPVMRRALKDAKAIRQEQQDRLVKAIYVGEASVPKRETP